MAMLKSILLVLILFCFSETIQLVSSVDGSSFQCPENERSALLDFKQGLMDKTNRLSSWVGQDCCKWQGVSCNNFTGHVVKLDLRNPNPYPWNSEDSFPWNSEDSYKARLIAVGEVNHSLLELKHLNYLDLSRNNFSGLAIPKFFGLFPELKYLNLSGSQFSGTVPHHLGNLSALQSLDLGDHNYYSSLVVDTLHWSSSLVSLRHLVMSGIDLSNVPLDSFQAITLFPSLLELRFSSCRLEKIPIFHSTSENLTSLTILDLSGNSFQGSIPNAIHNMTSLKVLILKFNQFSSNDSIFDELNNLNKLEVLDLSINEFGGKMIESRFPNFSSPSVGYLPNWLKSSLKVLELSYNSFEGEIPISFTAFQSLEELQLAGNKLSGCIPTSLGRMSALKGLSLYGNQLSGDIPVSLGKLSNLQLLILASNLFNGSIPKIIGGLSQLKHLDLSDNQFHGLVSDLHFVRLSKLKILDLSMNSLSIKIRSGWVPPFQLKVLDLASCDVGPQFPDWIFKQTSGFENITSLIDLSNNRINGTVPKSLCKIFSLKYIALSNNYLSGVLPHCLVALPNLSFMDLTSNNLSGTIHQMSFCPQSDNLEILHLSNNNFHGKFPSSLQKCTGLLLLDFSDNMFSGEIPTWIGKRLYFLKILRLSSNKYHSSLSPKLCHLTELQILDIAGNNLSGSIPRCFGNFRAMRYNRTFFLPFDFNEKLTQVIKGRELEYTWNHEKLTQVIKGRELEYTWNLRLVTNLDLSNNNFVGQVPEQLTDLHGLNFLNLSRNHLIGSIPKKIGQMRSLQSLDLSNNRLSGTIPQSISDLTSLSYLNLSNNNLSGPIPSGNQLQTFDASIYSGNSELCGLPLKKKCAGDEPPQTPTYVGRRSKGEDEGDEDKFITTWFYLGIVAGCVVGFWGFCGVLLFKKSLRYAYFQFVDDTIIDDWLFHSTARRNVGRRRRN